MSGLIFPNECLGCQRLGSWSIKNICPTCLSRLYTPYIIRRQNYLGYALGTHDELLQKLIIQSKFHANPYSQSILEQLFLNLYKAVFQNDIDYITSIPGFPQRIRYRQIDLPYSLAKHLSKKTKVIFEPKLLKHVKGHRSSQKGLSRTERLSNLRKSIVCTNSLHDKRVLVIDDVYTTGATIETAYLALKKSGAEKVYFLVISKTPFPL